MDPSGPDIWQLPASYLPHAAEWPDAERWLPALPVIAARRAREWGLAADGPAMHGWTGVVWPVRTREGRRAVMKVSPPVDGTALEITALRAFAADIGETPVPMIAPLAVDEEDRAILLPRLDSGRSLEDHADIDEAVTVIASLLAGIADVPAPTAGLPRLSDELDEIEPQLRPGGEVDPAGADRARGRLTELRALAENPARQRLLHGDAHFLNVLHTRIDEPAAWVGIDPSPLSGIIEWEPVPLLRNRWADASASGDPDRALRRRVDQICEATGGDRALVRACAQVQAVQAVAGWGLSPAHMHHPPYAIMSRW
ncbi:aminoglycoside phosphotransferase family protein [Brachybacterium hainanense]|uniref:Aminoglycoside phosphotransferase family protein n=1 Tax=Brachybacterium hainanense TaxID=1541174 RepID=A0ABV6RCF9_9MICO